MSPLGSAQYKKLSSCSSLADFPHDRLAKSQKERRHSGAGFGLRERFKKIVWAVSQFQTK